MRTDNWFTAMARFRRQRAESAAMESVLRIVAELMDGENDAGLRAEIRGILARIDGEPKGGDK